MGTVFDDDGALKYLFEQERSSVLHRLGHVEQVGEFLNVELPAILKRRVDLLARLSDG